MAAEAVLEAPVARVAAAPAEPAQRWVWQGRYGTIVIEVRGDDVYVDGQKVAMMNRD